MQWTRADTSELVKKIYQSQQTQNKSQGLEILLRKRVKTGTPFLNLEPDNTNLKTLPIFIEKLQGYFFI